MYDWMIASVEGEPSEGQPVRVCGSEARRFVAHGLWNEKGEIRIRLYAWDETFPVDAEWIRQKIDHCIHVRKNVLECFAPSGGCRLVYGDAEGLSGLNVDYYAGYAVVQIGASGLLEYKDVIFDALETHLSPKGIQLRLPALLSEQKHFASFERGHAPDEALIMVDGTLQSIVNLNSRQKTGFYLDQRENRWAAAMYAKGKTVLDLFSFSGMFGLACADRGADKVISVDSSEEAVETGKRNAALNGCARFEAVREDVMEFLVATSPASADMVILDPPKYAQGQASAQAAMAMYHRLNTAGLRALKPGGILVSCSCSGRVGTQEWLKTLASAARRSGRFLQLLELRGAARDHPVSIHCPETAYLKCGIFLVS